MANTTDPFAQAVHGTNPQYLIETITRQKIYNCLYWKEQCFGLTAETIIDKAIALKYCGGTYGGNLKPTNFLCLVLKLLQLQPEIDIALEFVRNEDFKYLRALGAFYLRLVGGAELIYETLEPLLNDRRKLAYRGISGWQLMHVDEFIDKLLTEELVCDMTLPHLVNRAKLEEQGVLAPRRSKLEEELQALEAEGLVEQEAHSSDGDDSDADSANEGVAEQSVLGNETMMRDNSHAHVNNPSQQMDVHKPSHSRSNDREYIEPRVSSKGSHRYNSNDSRDRRRDRKHGYKSERSSESRDVKRDERRRSSRRNTSRDKSYSPDRHRRYEKSSRDSDRRRRRGRSMSSSSSRSSVRSYRSRNRRRSRPEDSHRKRRSDRIDSHDRQRSLSTDSYDRHSKRKRRRRYNSRSDSDSSRRRGDTNHRSRSGDRDDARRDRHGHRSRSGDRNDARRDRHSHRYDAAEAGTSKVTSTENTKSTSKFDRIFGKKSKPTMRSADTSKSKTGGKEIVNDKGEKVIITAAEGTVEYWNQMRAALGMSKLK